MNDAPGACPHLDPGTIGQAAHPHCVVCGRDNDLGLGMVFTTREDGVVESEVLCGSDHEGYTEQLHGGVVAMLLDGVMTNCMFAHGREAVTAELTVRYREPVRTGSTARVTAWIVRSRRGFAELAASLTQDGRERAAARAKFIDR
jgi:uncharacterized protein (TIGR00369 family)